jgi:hypothetical protein
MTFWRIFYLFLAVGFLAGALWMMWALVYGIFYERFFWKALILGASYWLLAFSCWHKFRNPSTIVLFRKW